ncbi:4Fe-4S binding protein [bacterium]|nr:4Fe-4S binding protein [bacterium]
MDFRRWVQTFCLVVFIVLLVTVLSGVKTSFNVDFFLTLDPSIVLITSVSSRTFLFGYLPAVVVVILGLLLGRFFCGYICPMGTTLDVADSLFGVSHKKQKKLYQLRSIKYLLLVFLIGASLFGVSFVFFASPLSLITRFYGLLIYPIVTFLSERGHQLLAPLLEKLDLNSLLFLQIKSVRYSTQLFILLFFAGLFVLPRLTPRFWCRYICPAGAVMALFSRKPLLRRTVDSKCNDCGKCVRSCSMGAIYENNPALTLHEECITCLSCQRICPEAAVAFTYRLSATQSVSNPSLPSRRRFIISGMTGASVAIAGLTSLTSALGKTGEGRVLPPTLIRPPAALPEMEFLSRCIRCGECMVACPTNTLQPVWFKAGFMGLFSPAMILRRGYCDPDCHRCAQVCPTQAILSVTRNEREWAKTGTAVISRQNCLAWELDQKCMVCDEVCPFGAIELTQEDGISVPVPKVKEDKCSGCGYCEYHCPVQNQSAIIVSPLNAIRLVSGSLKSAGRQLGLRISREQKDVINYPGLDSPDGTAPGFETETPSERDPDHSGSLPPGFLD